MSESSWQRGENGSAPYLEPVPNGRGWTLFDPPVPGADEEKGEKADAAGAQAQRRGGGGGNYNLAQNLDEAPPSPGASDPIWPPPARRPSFIERLLAQRPASTPLPPQLRPPSGADGAQAAFARGPYPTVCPLPAGYGFGTQTPVVSNSPPRRKSLFPIISLPYMLPSSLRNAAAARMNQNKPEAPDSDFEGTIGGRDNELPMAKRLGKKANRFRCDVSSSGEERSPLAAPQGTTQALDCTPGLAGVGSAWPRLPPLDPLEVPSEGVDALTAADGAGAPTPPAAAAVRGGQFVRPAHRLMGPRPATLPELQRQRAQEALRGPTDEEAFDFDPRDARAKLIASVTRWQARTQDAEPVPGSFASISGSSRACRRPAAKRTITSTSGASYVSEGTTMTGSSSCPGKEDIQNPYMGQTALSPVPSIRPQFAATTTLESWLADERGDDVDLLSPLQEGSEIRFGGTPLVHPQTSLPPGYRTNASDEDRPISSPLPPPRAARSRASTRSQTSATTSTAPTSIFDETPHMRRREERKRERSAQAALANQLWGVGSAHAEKERLAQEEEVRLHHTVLDMSEDVSSKQEKTSLAPPTTVVRSGSTGTNSVYSSITAPSEYCASLFATGAGPALPSPAARPQERSDAFRARTRVVSGTVPAAHVPTPRTVPVAHTPMSIDSPWTSSDSDVSARRWAGVARPRGSFIVERKKPKNRVVTQPAQMQMSTPLALPRQRAASHGTTTAQAQTTRRVPHHERAVAGAFVNVNLVEAGDSRGPRKTRAASGPVASAQKQEREQQKQRRGASKEEATEQTQSGNFSSSTAPLDVRKRNGPM